MPLTAPYRHYWNVNFLLGYTCGKEHAQSITHNFVEGIIPGSGSGGGG